MDKLIKVDYSNADRPTVLGRDLHEVLGINSNYTTWFNRMCEYGFNEKVDYVSCFPNLKNKNQHGGQNKIDHQLTIEMAKEICMVQRTDIGKQCRQYFLEIERAWNTPEMLMARALKIAHEQIDSMKTTAAAQTQQIQKLIRQNDNLCNNLGLSTMTEIAKRYGVTANQLNRYLSAKGVIYKRSGQWRLYCTHSERGYALVKKGRLYWTQKGKEFIRELLKADGVLH